MRFDISTDFEWDAGNEDKNWLKHQVSKSECEEIFFDPEKIELRDSEHSKIEDRLIVLGKTKKEKLLFVVYTRRKDKIRVISARTADKKEEKLYEKNA
ncbi:MAG: BrnT family toxin [Candidatus Shapirobacteria bacterium]|jgi:hypothetical protein